MMDLSVLLPSCLRRRVLLGLVCWCCCNSVLWAQDSAMVSVDSLETTETVQTDSIVAATRPLPDSMVTADCKPMLRPKDVLVPVVITGLAALYVQNHGWFAQQKREVQKGLSAEGRHHLRADEVLQFAPMAAAWGLRLAGVKGKNEPKERLGIIALSYASLGLITFGMKAAVNEERPDGRDCRSFPSGHTARAFMGAEMLYQEYKDVSPWIGYSGYAMAALTGYLRVYNNRHYLNDVVAGACIGILCTKLGYWLQPKLFKKKKKAFKFQY
nr:phosphatase PAP2 family protein [Prevotella sp.]